MAHRSPGAHAHAAAPSTPPPPPPSPPPPPPFPPATSRTRAIDGLWKGPRGPSMSS